MNYDQNIYVLDIKRTAIGKFLGSLSNFEATQLPQPIIKHFVKKYPQIAKEIDEVIIGNVLSAGVGMNPARIISYQAGLSEKIPAATVNYVCGSGLHAIVESIKSILIDQGNIIVAGGTESMSNTPYLLTKSRKGMNSGSYELIDSLYHDGLYCPLAKSYMGVTAENIAKKYHITRIEQDKYALKSHQKAILAIDNGLFKEEIIDFPLKKGFFNIDEQPRRDTTIQKLKQLKPFYDLKGSITPGNSSSLNDGASLAFIVSEKIIKKYRLKPLARIVSWDYLGTDPHYMGLAPYYSIKSLIQKMKIKLNDIDLFEINEAFASQIIAVMRLLNINPKKLNTNGGAIALGHPIGASGTRILTTLIYELKRRQLQYGIASLCIGGGQGISIMVENMFN